MAGVTEVGWPYTARSPYLVVVAVYTYAVSYFFLLENWKKIVGPVWWLWRVCNNAATSLPEIICMQHHDVWLATFKGRCTENCDYDVQHHPMISTAYIYAVKDLSKFYIVTYIGSCLKLPVQQACALEHAMQLLPQL